MVNHLSNVKFNPSVKSSSVPRHLINNAGPNKRHLDNWAMSQGDVKWPADSRVLLWGLQ